jgi:RNA polymerase sigma-70 factor (ECF subfamily)
VDVEAGQRERARPALDPSDEALCRAVAKREPGAFDTLVERYQERAHRLAWSIVRDPEAAKDCSQDAFLRLHEAAGSFAGDSKFSTWFYRIVVNCCLDHRRRGKGWRRFFTNWSAETDDDRGDPIERLPGPFTDPGDVVDEDRRMTRLWKAVETLSPQQRAAVELSCRQGLPTKEIAQTLGLSEATVRVHLHRAMHALRRRMEKDADVG